MIYQLILVASMISLAESNCPEPDHHIAGSCFTFVNIPMAYSEAEQYCGYNAPNRWSYLAVEENDIQALWLARFANTLFSGARYFWIGVFRPTIYDQFRTVFNQHLTYQNFAQINPSMNYAAGRTSDGKWITLPEEERLPFVCSYKPDPEETTTATTETRSSWGWLKEYFVWN